MSFDWCFIEENAPGLLLVLASVILWVTFSLPVGAERRRFVTRYQPLAGFVGPFEVQKSSAPLQAPPRQEPPPFVTVGMPPRKAVAVRRKALRAQLAAERKDAPSHRWPHLISARTPAASAPTIEQSSATVSPAVAAEKPAAAIPPAKFVAETADHVADSYESDEARYLLDRRATLGAITLSLCGLSRKDGRFILKVSVSNHGGEDLFVRELSVRDGQALRPAKSYFRLFVEPGGTHEGYVVFAPPRSGADIHVALKEDREKGRVVEIAVPYSF